jgi:hypothetical protein
MRVVVLNFLSICFADTSARLGEERNKRNYESG